MNPIKKIIEEYNDLGILIDEAQPGDWLAISTLNNAFDLGTIIAYVERTETGGWVVEGDADQHIFTDEQLAYEIHTAYLRATKW